MDVYTIITVSGGSCALVMTVLLVAAVIMGGNLKKKVHLHYLALLLVCLLGTSTEIIVPLLFGTPGKGVAVMIRALDFLNYSCGSIMFSIFALYLYEFLSIKRRVSKKPFMVVAYLSMGNIPLLLVAQFNQMFAQLDENNNYIVQEAIWGTMVLTMLGMLIIIGVTLYNKNRLNLKELVSMLSYVLIPFFCYVVELVFPGVWIAYLGSTISLFLLYVNIQAELNQKLKKQEMELNENRIAIMLSQIQPHFLYNSLTAVGALCDIDPRKAKAAVTDFAHYLRGNLEFLEKRKLVFFEDELEHVRAYLALEQLRYKDRLRIQYEIEAEDFILPPLTVQPIVENAVRHGLMERRGGGTVCIRTQTDDHGLLIIISDNGVGFDPEVSENDGRVHVGIKNVRERITILCHGTLDIRSVPGMGTTAVITIPYEGG